MDPLKLLRDSIGDQRYNEAASSWVDPIKEITDELPGLTARIFLVRGGRKTFEFPMLPSGSYGYWCANGRESWQLKANGTGLNKLIAESWDEIKECNVIALADFILRFNGRGIRYGHSVLGSVDDLSSINNERIRAGGYKINEK